MLTGRGLAVVSGAVLLWVASRLVGSPGLHIIAAGLLALVAFAVAAARLRSPSLHATRRLSTRRAFPGARVRIDVVVENRGRVRTSLLLVEDRVPAALGAAPRAVLPEVPPGERRSVSYHVTARVRGRYEVGPVSAWVADTFDLTRATLEFPERHELVVYPEVEQLEGSLGRARTGGGGDSASREAFRTGDDFYTMRDYQLGDDLRRIHWASTARTGKLMIRQDETARRSTAVILLDTRARALGASTAAFERSVSAAASIGMLHTARGSTLHLVTPDVAPQEVAPEEFLGALAVVGPSPDRVLRSTLDQMGKVAGDTSTLSAITHAPTPDEIGVLVRAGATFASRLAVLVWPREPAELPAERRAAMNVRLEAARGSLIRAGWTVLVLRPHGRLREVWRTRDRRPAGTTALSS